MLEFSCYLEETGFDVMQFFSDCLLHAWLYLPAYVYDGTGNQRPVHGMS